MLKKTLITLGSWLVGIIGVVGIIWYYEPQDFAETLNAVGYSGVLTWVVLTLLSRVCAAEATVAPLATLGFHMSRPDAFWISWIRTFANQILPLAGIAAYAHMVRRRVGIPWSQLAALGQPQLLLAAAAIGVVGFFAIVVNLDRLDASAYTLALAYAGIVLLAMAFANGSAWLIESLPAALAERATGTSDALRAIAKDRPLIIKLVVFHISAVLLRGGRIWILFAAAGFSLDWRELLLVLAIAESALLLNVTPGGLGIREGAVLGGAALLGIPAPVAASVALIDRLFMVSITTLLAMPGFAILRKPHDAPAAR
jgi:uncharacterized membrane protein YbhN (UPF0104 family)